MTGTDLSSHAKTCTDFGRGNIHTGVYQTSKCYIMKVESTSMVTYIILVCVCVHVQGVCDHTKRDLMGSFLKIEIVHVAST